MCCGLSLDGIESRSIVTVSAQGGVAVWDLGRGAGIKDRVRGRAGGWGLGMESGWEGLGLGVGVGWG